MNSELAKKLKDAGFPQKTRGNVLIKVPAEPKYERPGYWKPLYSKNTKKNGLINVEWLYTPTLEELIEACGVHFGKLIRSPGNGFDAYPGWEMNNVPVRGSTPTEAVAKLWLALNTK